MVQKNKTSSHELTGVYLPCHSSQKNHRISNSEAQPEGQTNQEALALQASSVVSLLVCCTQKSKRITPMSQAFQILGRVPGARILMAEAHEAATRLDDVDRRWHRAWMNRLPLSLDHGLWRFCLEHLKALWEKILGTSRSNIGASARSNPGFSSRHPRNGLEGPGGRRIS